MLYSSEAISSGFERAGPPCLFGKFKMFFSGVLCFPVIAKIRMVLMTDSNCLNRLDVSVIK